ncbi:ABC transporter permease [Phycicoccus sp. CSK15P-2]|uniref:ABC transporter permease n=1 Tax=Phycicoccus sp. CSK15P-2 TaxID=2807627 RepID=UPI001950B3FB|nr:ABC transporter permease [Phycicoccus sp. CSK15P-2]MBM6403497.1 ABC transporter permease [Phycicoccus sp. CSK15P-2]
MSPSTSAGVPLVVEDVDVSRLRPVGRRPNIARYIANLWGRRHFIVADSRVRALSGERDTILGRFWLVGRPLLDGVTFFLIFGVLLNASRGIDNYIGFLLIGVFLFTWTSQSLTQGAASLNSGRNLIRGFAFPRASIPLALALREAIAMGPRLLTLVAMILVIPPHAQISWYWVLFPGVLVLQGMFNVGVVLYAARLVHAVPDLRLLLGFSSRLWMYGSGVMYSIDRFVEHPQALAVMQLNPAYCVLEISRDLLLYATLPEPRLWLTLAAWAAATPVLGFLYFWQGEEEYGRE